MLLTTPTAAPLSVIFRLQYFQLSISTSFFPQLKHIFRYLPLLGKTKSSFKPVCCFCHQFACTFQPSFLKKLPTKFSWFSFSFLLGPPPPSFSPRLLKLLTQVLVTASFIVSYMDVFLRVLFFVWRYWLFVSCFLLPWNFHPWAWWHCPCQDLLLMPDFVFPSSFVGSSPFSTGFLNAGVLKISFPTCCCSHSP